MNYPKYVLQIYREAHGDKGSGWRTIKIIRRRKSFIFLCALAAKNTRRDRMGRQILLYPHGTKLAVFKYGSDNKYYEGLTAPGARLRDMELKARERANPSDDEAIEDIDDDIEQDIAESRRIALQRYNAYPKPNWIDRVAGNIPRIYHCLACRLYFAIPGTRREVKCGYCRSTKVRRVK